MRRYHLILYFLRTLYAYEKKTEKQKNISRTLQPHAEFFSSIKSHFSRLDILNVYMSDYYEEKKGKGIYVIFRYLQILQRPAE